MATRSPKDGTDRDPFGTTERLGIMAVTCKWKGSFPCNSGDSIKGEAVLFPFPCTLHRRSVGKGVPAVPRKTSVHRTLGHVGLPGGNLPGVYFRRIRRNFVLGSRSALPVSTMVLMAFTNGPGLAGRPRDRSSGRQGEPPHAPCEGDRRAARGSRGARGAAIRVRPLGFCDRTPKFRA